MSPEKCATFLAGAGPVAGQTLPRGAAVHRARRIRRTPDMSEIEIEGIATTMTVDGRTAAAVACIGDHDEVNTRADVIVDFLREKRGRWDQRR